MPKNLKLLLTENVDGLGIVGDVVNVRMGYARNFLLPRSMATTPSDEAIKAVAARRAEAERELAELRKQREGLIKKLEGIEVSIQRSCNDLGHLYASVTQQDIAAALEEAGYPGVKPRDVRLNQNVKRIDAYDVSIKFESDLEATIKLWVVADRKLDLDKAHEAEAAAATEAEAPAEAADEAAEDKPATEAGARKPRKPKTGAKPAKEPTAKAAEAPKTDDKSGWGKKVEIPTDLIPQSPRRGRRSRG